MVHVPTATSVTMLPETVQVLVVALLKATVKPDEALAELLMSKAGSPSDLAGNVDRSKLIVWSILSTVNVPLPVLLL
jgi:hypothetical protein